MLKLSIIVPAYNAENYLRRCLNSLVNQTIKDIEILIINDESTDNTQLIIDEYVNEYPSICKSFIQKHSGQAVARNLGIKYARGKFIAFVDSDDFVEINAYETALNKAEKENLDIVCFDFYEIVDNEKRTNNYYCFKDEENPVKKYIISETSPWNKIIKTSLLKENNITFLENKIYEDLATIPTLAKFTQKIAFLPDKIYNYVIHENSTMRYTIYNKKMEDIFEVLDNLYNNFINTQYTEELEYLYIEHLLYAAFGRFLQYEDAQKNLNKIVNIMKAKYPNWKKNKYYKQRGIIYKFTCNIFYKNNKFIIMIYNKFRNSIK